jgi:hypothetical protein
MPGMTSRHHLIDGALEFDSQSWWLPRNSLALHSGVAPGSGKRSERLSLPQNEWRTDSGL